MAKKKDSKVSIAKLDEYLKGVKQDAVEVEVGGLVFEVKPMIDLADFHAMVNAAADAAFVFDEEAGVERYNAVYESYAHDIAIFTYVANFKPETASEKLFALSQCRAVMNKICEVWSENQRWSFEDAVSRQIDFKQKELLAAERKKLNDAVKQIEVASDSFMKFTALFEGMDTQKVMEDMQKIANMSELELGHAVVAAREGDFVEQRRAELQVLK